MDKVCARDPQTNTKSKESHERRKKWKINPNYTLPVHKSRNTYRCWRNRHRNIVKRGERGVRNRVSPPTQRSTIQLSSKHRIVRREGVVCNRVSPPTQRNTVHLPTLQIKRRKPKTKGSNGGAGSPGHRSECKRLKPTTGVQNERPRSVVPSKEKQNKNGNVGSSPKQKQEIKRREPNKSISANVGSPKQKQKSTRRKPKTESRKCKRRRAETEA